MSMCFDPHGTISRESNQNNTFFLIWTIPLCVIIQWYLLLSKTTTRTWNNSKKFSLFHRACCRVTQLLLLRACYSIIVTPCMLLNYCYSVHVTQLLLLRACCRVTQLLLLRACYSIIVTPCMLSSYSIIVTPCMLSSYSIIVTPCMLLNYCYTVHVVDSLSYYTNHSTYIKFIKFTH